MRHNKILKALAVTTTVVLSTSVLAATVTGSVGFRTIKDVTVTETNSVNFGNSIVPLAGKTCSFAGFDTGLATGASKLAVPTSTAAIDIAGTGCTDGDDATPGYFTISGATGASIKITVNSSDAVAFPDYTFTPAVQYSAFPVGGAANTSADNTNQIGTNIFPDTTTTVVLNDANVTNADDGQGTLFVGGTLSIVNDLSYDTSYSVDYVVDVTY